MIKSWLMSVALLVAVSAFGQNSNSDSAAATVKPAVQEEAKGDTLIDELQVECSPASRASELIGKNGCVAGKVYRVTTAKTGATHVSLCPSGRKCGFHVLVRKHDRDKVGDLSHLRGKYVAVIGQIVESRGHAQIVVKDREQIRTAADDTPGEFDAARTMPVGKPVSGSKRRSW